MSLEKTKHGGYITAAFGSLIGAITLGSLGTYLGINYTKFFMPNAELEGVIPPLLGAFLGWWIGEVMGCWLALRWRGYRKPKKTAILLTSLTPFGIFLWMVIHPVISNLFRGGLDDVEFLAIDNKIRMITASLTSIGLALLARDLTLVKEKNQTTRSPTSLRSRGSKS
jgi:hypothetical protein